MQGHDEQTNSPKRLRIPTPAPRDKQEPISRLVLSMLYATDPDCREFLASNGFTMESIPFEYLMESDIGILIKMVELSVQYARDYPERMHLMPLGEYLQSHVPMLNQLHHSMFKAQGYDFPIDDSLSDISQYIGHFLRYRPDKGPLSIPPHMIPHLTDFLINLYCGTPENIR